jgi:quinoprotein glucose dehydrogenase
VPQQVTENDLWGATPEDLQACRQLLHSLRNEGIFTPPSVRGSLHVPGNIGGLHWGGMAWDAKHRLLIAPVNRYPAIIRLIPQDQLDAARREFPRRETSAQRGAPYAMSRVFFEAPSNTPCTAPPWGELVAIHADSGELAWRIPLGDLRAALNATSMPTPLASPNLGGPATTQTGIVFIGAALDPYLRAFDTREGRKLWEAKLPASARATPLIYTLPDGRQMVAIAAGGHDTPLSHLDSKLVVFALR